MGFCIGVAVLFVLLDYFVNVCQGSSIGSIRRLFNITREDALPSWFGVTQTFLAALTALLITALARARGSRGWVVAGWIFVTVLLAYMAADDGAKIHERIGTAARMLEEARTDAEGELPGRGTFAWFPSYSWQVVMLPVFAVSGFAMFTFLWGQLRPRSSRWLLLGAFSLFALAVGLDFVEGLDRGHPWNLNAWITSRWSFNVYSLLHYARTDFEMVVHSSKAIEECVEMIAMTLLWAALLKHLGTTTPAFRVEFTPTAPRS